MFLRRSSILKYSIAAYLGAAVYCEWFVYIAQPMYWDELECQSSDTSCTKILFVADPQIQGDLAVPGLLGMIINWDSDRYLKQTFSVVMNYFKPDVVVYMGDLMDEGSISSMQQFHGYVKRLSTIFDINYTVTQVWLPGDNDIGGENEPIKHDKIEEFEKVFNQPSVVNHKNISFYKVNGITHTYPHEKPEETQSNYKIIVSHYPITSRAYFAKQVSKEINPNIYFCAHEHESKYVTQDKNFSNRRVHRQEYSAKMLEVPNDDTVYEIFVPTCSYRMGTGYIGYGAAVLEKNNQRLRYTVFWSSKRFPYLFFHLVALILVILYCWLYCVTRLCHRRSAYKENADKLPLLERI